MLKALRICSPWMTFLPAKFFTEQSTLIQSLLQEFSQRLGSRQFRSYNVRTLNGCKTTKGVLWALEPQDKSWPKETKPLHILPFRQTSLPSEVLSLLTWPQPLRFPPTFVVLWLWCFPVILTYGSLERLELIMYVSFTCPFMFTCLPMCLVTTVLVLHCTPQFMPQTDQEGSLL